jgi:hypothetical protein
LGGSGEQVFGGKDAVGADEPGDLEVEGKEGEEVGQTGQPGEKPKAKGIVQEPYFDRPTFLGK